MKNKIKIISVALGAFLSLGLVAMTFTSSALTEYGMSEEDKAKLLEIKQKKSVLEIEKEDHDLKSEQLEMEINELIKEADGIREKYSFLPTAKAETLESQKSDLDRLAYAIAMAETKDCTLGYGASYSNCFGIKDGSIAPCTKIGKNKMCIYNSRSEAYEAFKKIWTKGYGGGYPTYRMAQVWTGGDRPDNWLKNVKFYYNK